MPVIIGFDGTDHLVGPACQDCSGVAIPHPILFGAVPVGRGEGHVEALTSFFSRLCLARFLPVRAVVQSYVLGCCPLGSSGSNPNTVSAFIGRGGRAIDLQPGRALPFAAALEELTGLSSLAAHSFAVCARFLEPGSNGRLGLPLRRWCPSCFAEWQAAGLPMYEPLLWRFALATRCSVHGRALAERCPRCERAQSWPAQKVPIGHCIWCGHRLFEFDADQPSRVDFSSLPNIDRWDYWRSVALSRVLAWSSALEDSTAVRSRVILDAFARLLEHVCAHRPEAVAGNRRTFAGLLGVGITVLDGLRSGERRPTLPFFLDVCMQLGVDPVRIVRGEYAEGETTWPTSECIGGPGPSDLWRCALEVRECRSARRYPARARALDDYVADTTVVDLAGAMRVHRAKAVWLTVAFPLRHARALAVREERLSRLRRARAERYAAVLEKDIAQGGPRPLSEAAVGLGVSTDTLAHFVPELVARLGAVRRCAAASAEAALQARAERALVEALSVPHGETATNIARRFGLHDLVLSRLAPDAYARLVALRKAQRLARWDRCVRAMRRGARYGSCG